MRLRALVIGLLLAACPRGARRGDDLEPAHGRGEGYVQTRAGVESFALVDDRGHIHGYRLRARAPSASLLKAMALVAYLNLQSVRSRPLNDHDRGLLGPMIRRSDNAAASAVLRTVGSHAMYRVAERADMWDFSFAWPIWGNSTTTARDQARFFIKIDRLVPRRHRGYALAVLAEHRALATVGDPAGAPAELVDPLQGRLGIGHRAASRTSPRSCARERCGSPSRCSRSRTRATATAPTRSAASRPASSNGRFRSPLTNENEELGSLTSAGCGDRRG